MKPYNEVDVSKNEGISEDGIEYSELTPDGKQVKAYKPAENFYWMNGLEEYLRHIDHKHLEYFLDIKKAIMHGNIWKIRKRLICEIQRGFLDKEGRLDAYGDIIDPSKFSVETPPLSVEFVNILLAHYSGWNHAKHRKILRYVSYCIDDDFIRKISSWSIKWQAKANLNDHFSRGQMRSKMWMVDKLNEKLDSDYLGTVFHYGGWYATIAKLLFDNFRIKQYFNFEIDPTCTKISEDFNYEQYRDSWNYKCIIKDCGTLEYGPAGDTEFATTQMSGERFTFCITPGIIINTSCEHMNEDWFHNLPDGQLICLQTNDYFSNEQHSNCCKDLADAEAKYPMSEVLYSGELDTDVYKRFMLIGRK